MGLNCNYSDREPTMTIPENSFSHTLPVEEITFCDSFSLIKISTTHVY